jgi:hypothetical protein
MLRRSGRLAEILELFFAELAGILKLFVAELARNFEAYPV